MVNILSAKLSSKSVKMNVLYCFAICVILPLIAAETLKFHPRSRSKSNFKTDGELAMLLEQYLFNGHEGKNLKNFVFKSCGGNTNSTFSLNISPDPITFPGTLTINAKVDLKQDIAEPLKAILTVEKSVQSMWIKLPCIANIGSCTYTDLCKSLESATCPQDVQKFCRCPIKANTYDESGLTFEVDAAVFPSGDYRVKAIVTFGSDGKYSQCIDAMFSIGT